MIIGVGVDIVDVGRFDNALKRSPRLLERLFGEVDPTLGIQSLAARFAAKEALIKALGKSSGLSFKELGVVKDSEGRPYFELSGNSKKTVEEAGVEVIHLSLSHDGSIATAFVVAEGGK